MGSMVPVDISLTSVRLVLSRVELVELIFMIEAGMNQRVVEYVKYSIFSRNVEKMDPEAVSSIIDRLMAQPPKQR